MNPAAALTVTAKLTPGLTRLVRATCLTGALVFSPMALAIGSLTDLTVVDRDTGQTLPVYQQGGRHYVAGRPGARYAVSLRNRTGERVLTVVSVDGVNVVSGETAGWMQTGYVLDRWQGYQITGWRKSDQQVAAFEFTALGNSYAARTGRPANVGVIGVAVFREKAPVVDIAPAVPLQAPPPVPVPRGIDRAREMDSSSVGAAGAGASAAPAAPASPASAGTPAQAERRSRNNEAAADSAAEPSSARGIVKPSAKLGTGHGAREDSVVSRTNFERLHSAPDEQLSIWYDSRENLVAMGVIPAPRPPLARPTPFPQSAQSGYVQDPPLR